PRRSRRTSERKPASTPSPIRETDLRLRDHFYGVSYRFRQRERRSAVADRSRLQPNRRSADADHMMSALQRSIVLRTLLRWRYLVLIVASVAAALIEVRTTGPSSDGGYFASAGRDLLSAHGLHVYASRGLQAGPLQLAAFGAFSHLTSWLRLPFDSTYAVTSTVASTAVIVGGLRLLRRRLGLAASPAAELATGVLAVAWLVATEAYTS